MWLDTGIYSMIYCFFVNFVTIVIYYFKIQLYVFFFLKNGLRWCSVVICVIGKKEDFFFTTKYTEKKNVFLSQFAFDL
jgi:hypothetical protein